MTLLVSTGWRQSLVATWRYGPLGSDIWIARLSFTVPAGSTYVLRVTDWQLSSELPSIWSATGTQVSGA